jgi:hypothetical protein
MKGESEAWVLALYAMIQKSSRVRNIPLESMDHQEGGALVTSSTSDCPNNANPRRQATRDSDAITETKSNDNMHLPKST